MISRARPLLLSRSSIFQQTTTRAQITRIQSYQSTSFKSYVASNEASLLDATQDLSLGNGSSTRLKEFSNSSIDPYPRLSLHDSSLTCSAFSRKFSHVTSKDDFSKLGEYTIRGRVLTIRTAGSKLVFLDIVEDGHKLQAVCNFKHYQPQKSSTTEFKDFFALITRGDILELRGYPSRTSSGELSIVTSAFPRVLSACLRTLPTQLQDQEVRSHNRHVDLLINNQTAHTLRLRSEIINHIRTFLQEKGHVEVQTPILMRNAGGAAARPFQTTATEFGSRKLEMRIAPELWLKRLVIGGLDRVFEIGPCFRNEGLDSTHNPEFTTCEFYRAYSDVEELITLTEELFISLDQHTRKIIKQRSWQLVSPEVDFQTPFKRIDFTPALESALGQPLPNLASLDAHDRVLQLLNERHVPAPSSPTLPSMLDRLAAEYLESQCEEPTFIVNHPECMSPLAKSFRHPGTKQMVAARAELFIGKKEIVNLYEEENGPVTQQQKMLKQLEYKNDETQVRIDDDYIDALKWGLPPTGGWGAGIDRICMLFCGVPRIGHVLSFGSLRNVVSIGKSQRS